MTGETPNPLAAHLERIWRALPPDSTEYAVNAAIESLDVVETALADSDRAVEEWESKWHAIESKAIFHDDALARAVAAEERAADIARGWTEEINARVAAEAERDRLRQALERIASDDDPLLGIGSEMDFARAVLAGEEPT